MHTLGKCWPQVYKLVQIFAMGFLVLLRLGSLWGQDYTEKDGVGKVLCSRLPCEKDEIVAVHQLARDQECKMLVWTGDTTTAAPNRPPTPDQEHAPLTYTPPHLAEKILTSRSALEGERKQVTVLFADLMCKHPRYVPCSCKACQILSGVRGVSIWRTPTCDSASITALAIATGAASVGNSPMPLAPRGFRGDSVSTVSRVNAGVVLALGKA